MITYLYLFASICKVLYIKIRITQYNDFLLDSSTLNFKVFVFVFGWLRYMKFLLILISTYD